MSLAGRRVLVAAADDYANAGYAYAAAFRSAGCEVRTFKLVRHAFGYEGELDVYPSESDLVPLARGCDVYFGVHGQLLPPELGPEAVVLHHNGSTAYLLDPERFHRVWNSRAAATVVDHAAFLGLGDVRPVLLPPPVDCKRLRPIPRAEGPRRVIGFFPSNPLKKGGLAVLSAVRRLRGDPETRDRFELRTGGPVPWREHVLRLAACDVVVDQLCWELDGRPLGEWGVTSREAAALGCAVVTNARFLADYERVFGPCPLQVANDPNELAEVLRRLVLLSWDDLRSIADASRSWVERCHGIEAVARGLAALLGSDTSAHHGGCFAEPA